VRSTGQFRFRPRADFDCVDTLSRARTRSKPVPTISNPPVWFKFRRFPFVCYFARSELNVPPGWVPARLLFIRDFFQLRTLRILVNERRGAGKKGKKKEKKEREREGEREREERKKKERNRRFFQENGERFPEFFQRFIIPKHMHSRMKRVPGFMLIALTRERYRNE